MYLVLRESATRVGPEVSDAAGGQFLEYPLLVSLVAVKQIDVHLSPDLLLSRLFRVLLSSLASLDDIDLAL